MDVDGATYTNVHRALLQSFLARGTLTIEAARPVIAGILSVHEEREVLEGDITETDFNTLVSVINSAISQYDLEIRNTFTQLGQSTNYTDGRAEGRGGGRVRVFALINTTSDAMAQLATVRTAEELAFMGRILDDMFDKYNHESGKEILAISHNQAIRLSKPSTDGRQTQRNSRASMGDGGGETQSTTQGLTMKQAEATLKSIVEEGWLERTGSTRDPYYMLSPRALLELKSWLVETYNEPGDAASDDEMDDDDADGPGRRGIEKIKACAACNDIVLSGQRCSDKRCRTRLHDACTGAMWRSQRGSTACPGCKRAWTGTDFVGVRAAGVSLDASGARRDSGRGSGGRAQQQQRQQQDADAATTSFSSGSRTAGRRSAGGSRGGSTGMGDDEDEEDE